MSFGTSRRAPQFSIISFLLGSLCPFAAKALPKKCGPRPARMVAARHRNRQSQEETGVVIVAAVVQTMHAQTKPPVYMEAINELKDAEGYRTKYLPTAQQTIKDHSGVYVANGPGSPIDGSMLREL